MGRGDRNHRVSEERKCMYEMEKAMNHCCRWCACGMPFVTTESGNTCHHWARHCLEWPLWDCEQEVSLHYSDHKIFLMYILNEVQHEIVLKLIFHYIDNIWQKQERLNVLSIQHSCTCTTWQCRVVAQPQQNPLSCMCAHFVYDFKKRYCYADTQHDTLNLTLKFK